MDVDRGKKLDPDAVAKLRAKLKGDKGDSGPAGLRGADGPEGAVGSTGPEGATGPTGATGAAGVGHTGPAGATGAPGPKGAKGDTGATGPAGPAGSVDVHGIGIGVPPTQLALDGWVLTRTGKHKMQWRPPTGGGGGTATGDAVTKEITQAHDFLVGEVLRLDVTTYIRALADTPTNAEVVGIVTAVTSATAFTITMGGHVSVLSGLTAGRVYFLSDTIPGAFTLTEPTAAGAVSKPLFVSDSTTGGYIDSFRGEIIEPPVNIDPEAPHLLGAPGEPAFQNGWANFGGSLPVGSFYKHLGRVYFEGVFNGGSDDTVLFTLPAGYWPAYTEILGGNTLNVHTDGGVTIKAPAGGWYSICGLSFRHV